jgi:hypothetical protein
MTNSADLGNSLLEHRLVQGEVFATADSVMLSIRLPQKRAQRSFCERRFLRLEIDRITDL